MPAINFTRTLRTPASERFLLTIDGKESAASLDVHYLYDNGVAATLCVLERGIADDQIGAIIEHIDEALLPEASRAEGNLHFTVVRGEAIGDFVPHALKE